MKPRTFPRGWVAPLLFVLTVVSGSSAPFSADLVDTRGDQTTTGKFYYQDKSYRFEFGAKDQPLIIMVDGSSGVMRLVNPLEKAYYEAGPAEPMTLFANPFALYAHLSKTKEVRTEGVESIDGSPCKKLVVFGGEQVFVTAWVSDEFDFPLKVKTELDGRTIELRNIRRGPQDPALFVLPTGCQLTVVKEEPEPQPEWAGQVAGAPLLAVPFEKTLKAGELVRLRPKDGRWVGIAGTNTSQGQGSFTTAAFKGGKYVGGGSMSTLILDPGNSGAMNDGSRSATVDEIIIRVGEGTMKIKTSYVTPPPPRPGETPPAAEPVAPGSAASEAAEISAPAAINMAAPVEVSWTGPGAKDDFITVARPAQPPGSFDNRAFVRNGNPAKLWAPSDPGEYEVRYILGRGVKLLAKAPLTVNAVTASVQSPVTAMAGTEFEISWQGPGYARDFISIARPGQPPGASVNSTRIRPGGTLKVRAPREPGTYELRYIVGRGAKQLAKTVITVTAP